MRYEMRLRGDERELEISNAQNLIFLPATSFVFFAAAFFMATSLMLFLGVGMLFAYSIKPTAKTFLKFSNGQLLCSRRLWHFEFQLRSLDVEDLKVSRIHFKDRSTKILLLGDSKNQIEVLRSPSTDELKEILSILREFTSKDFSSIKNLAA